MNPVRKFAVFAFALSVVTESFAVRHVGFEVDSFNRAFEVGWSTNVVFSPLSFEIDCAMAAESLETLPRAAVAESMGVLVEFAGVYRPIMESHAVRAGSFGFVSARGFCIPDIRTAKPDFRRMLQRVYGAEVMPAFPAEGAGSWFRATMDGAMEDFSIPTDSAASGRYSFYDLLAVNVEWQEPFPLSNTRTLKFHCADGTDRKLPFMSDVRVADAWDAREYLLMKLPLKGQLDYYAMMPKEGLSLAAVRQDFSSMEIDLLLTMAGQTGLRGNYHGTAAIVLPRLELASRVDFTSVMRDFRVPLSDLKYLTGRVSPKEYVQHVRFRLAEHGLKETPVERKSEERQVRMSAGTRKFVFNRPFLFFVHDRETQTIPVAGIFTGLD